MNLQRRWYYHCYKSSGCRFLHNAIQKHGAENFTVEQIDIAATKEELDEKEKYWIEHYNSIAPNGYNLKSGGSTPTYSDDSKKRMSENHANVSGENNPRFGVHLSKETKRKISESSKGKQLSEQHKRKVRENSILRKIVLNIETGEKFISTREAEQAYNLSHGMISRVCRGKGKTAGGYHWKYESEVV